MAKHPVPKRKTSKSRSRQRYSAFQFKTRKKLEGAVNLVTCQNCGAKTRLHHVCGECGQYRGKQIIDKSKDIDKITKIKA